MIYNIWDKCIETIYMIFNKCKVRFCKKDDTCVISLAPNIPKNKNEYKIYKLYLNHAFKDQTIRNIAITGNYGIGKSSFLKWFGKKKKFLVVSMCDFYASESNMDSLECNLIQQILIGCKPSSNKKYIWKFLIFIVALAVSLGIAYFLLATNKMGCLDIIDGHLSNMDIKRLVDKMKFYMYLIVGNMLFMSV